MSIEAELYRARASAITKLYVSTNDAGKLTVAAMLAQSYEALAKNEEWLSGEVSPCEPRQPRSTH